MSYIRRTLRQCLTAGLKLSFALCIPIVSAQSQEHGRLTLSADADWKFSLGDPKHAETTSFDDHGWRTVNLPHDWSIEGQPEEKNPMGASGGYFPSGIAWYRRTFSAPSAWKGKHVAVDFGGVSMNATVYLNGHELGTHPYAYTSFQFDLTPWLNVSGKNVLAVRVDTSEQPASRWYAGAGIYRHVRIVVTNPTQIAHWGVFVTTPEVTQESARVRISTRILRGTDHAGKLVLRTTVHSPAGTALPASEKSVTLRPDEEYQETQEMTLEHPQLWSPEHPTLYKATTEVIWNGRPIDRVETIFGIRSIAWSVDHGLLLNGKPYKLAGGSVHSDNGPLGVAAFDRAEERKAELLKAAGFNAVRTAHNPPSTAFLDACDRIGLLVLDEPFDVWTVSKRTYDYARLFNEWWKRDLDSMVERDRNHPSIIMWGIGNEIPEAWTSAGAPIAQKLAARVRELDPTRPLTEAFPGATYGPNPDAVFSIVDIGGYNYNLAQNQAKDHERVPSRIMMTTESFPADAFEQWQLVHDHNYIVGEFVWTAMDYLGESGIGAWSYGTPKEASQLRGMNSFLRGYLAKMGADGKNPMAPFQNGQPPSPIAPEFPWHAAYCGDLDLTGFRKPESYYRDILWNGGDRLFLTVRLPETEDKKILAAGWAVYPTLPSWTWPDHVGKTLSVEVYSGTERVQLFLNNRLLGEKATGKAEEFKATFEVPYEPGTLKAVGLDGDRIVTQTVLQTTGDPVRLRLTPDRTTLRADNQDLSFVTVEAVDDAGRLNNNYDGLVRFTIRGQGSIAAAGSGDGSSLIPYSSQEVKLFHGRALVVLRTSGSAGTLHLMALAPTLPEATLDINSVSDRSVQQVQ